MTPAPRPRTLPKAGRFRLYRWASPRRVLLRCKACRKCVKRENQWRHFQTEVRRHGGVEALAARLELLAAKRRGRLNLRHGRFVFAAGSSDNWRDRERAFGGKA